MKPDSLTLFMNWLIRGRVVPMIPAKVSWLIDAVGGPAVKSEQTQPGSLPSIREASQNAQRAMRDCSADFDSGKPLQEISSAAGNRCSQGENPMFNAEDTALQTAVLAELGWEPSITSGHIGVTADNGVVTLIGHVETFAQKRAAEDAAGRVKGVKAVAEEIEVKLPFAMRRADEQLAAAVLFRFSWDVSVPKDRVKVKVENGWITLSGDVDWHFQSVAAADACRQLYGVVSVINEIAIKPRARSSEIQEKIKTALHRSWYEPANVNVSAEGGKVKLTGSVRNWYERQHAEMVAWGAPGVTQVDCNIIIR